MWNNDGISIFYIKYDLAKYGKDNIGIVDTLSMIRLDNIKNGILL